MTQHNSTRNNTLQNVARKENMREYSAPKRGSDTLYKDDTTSPLQPRINTRSVTKTQKPGPAPRAKKYVARARPLLENDINRPDIAGAAVVHEFLKTCHPPMDHYLSAFIKFGCSTESHLRSFAKFNQEKKYGILKELLAAHPVTEGFTEMDVAVLENQLEVYYL
ncbi:hypothetical protein CPB84DRAFT_176979 [Gymnopilus junonius]|uniref:Uncharacterized protein n=1 Tax=Gymnopilus junonius TaxID=109634 RepID=A0A9P5NDN0_GYMJU|nr:hypothetical protein CPB84DRAFT_176979 [Gymnopilus junonius]